MVKMVALAPELHLRLKHLALDRGITLQKLIDELLVKALDDVSSRAPQKARRVK